MQFLATVARVLGRFGSRHGRLLGFVALGTRGRRGRDFRGGTALGLGFLLGTRFFLRTAGFFSLFLLGGFVFDAPAVLRLDALAFLARRFQTVPFGLFQRF